MKLTSLRVKNLPPIRRFEVDNLSELVIIAGPNGVGKSRLLDALRTYFRQFTTPSGVELELEATSSTERQSWHKCKVGSTNTKDNMALRTSLNKVRHRMNWQSSALYFESDRTFRDIGPYAPTWGSTDPRTTTQPGSLGTTNLAQRFTETVHSIFALVERRNRGISDDVLHAQRDGQTEIALQFDDPIEEFIGVFHRLLAPKTMLDPVPKDGTLKFRLGPDDLSLKDLSSGEQEVVRIAFDFLLRKPSDCIIFMDEIELHLHPELTIRLIRALQSIGERNQFILCTHSPELISHALDHTVVFLGPPTPSATAEPENQAHVLNDDDSTKPVLKLLGNSLGMISLGKKIVLIEGTQSSLDQQTYRGILGDRFPELVLVPSEGKELIRSFQAVANRVLNKTLWGVDFFLLCDRDTVSLECLDVPHPQMRLLNRYHLENYFLDENVWCKVFDEMDCDGSWLKSPTNIRARLKEIAREVMSYAVALHVSAIIRQSAGNIDIMPKDCDGKSAHDVSQLLCAKADEQRDRVTRVLDRAAIDLQVHAQIGAISTSLDEDTDEWKRLLPGRPLLNKFIHQTQLRPQQRAKQLYIRRALEAPANPFAEIESIFQAFSEH